VSPSPVTDALSLLDDFRPLVDAHPIGDLPAFGRLSVGFSTCLMGHAKIPLQSLGPLGVGPDPSIDRRVADRCAAERAYGQLTQTPGDLLGSPASLQLVVHVAHEPMITRLRMANVRSPATVGLGLGRVGQILTDATDVAPHLAADSASMTAEAASHLRLALAENSHSIDDIPFVEGKMVVGHRADSFRLRLCTSLNLPESNRDVLFFCPSLHLRCEFAGEIVKSGTVTDL